MAGKRWGRTYLREQAGRTETIIGAVILVLLVALITTFIIHARSDAPALFAVEPEGVTDSRASVEPTPVFPRIEGLAWRAPDNVTVYTPDNLWEKINGRADFYLAYHVERMIFGTYRAEDDPTRMIDVYWFDLGEPDNAFAVYQAEYGGQVQRLDVGREGYRAGGSIFFCKAGYYLRIEAPSDEPVYLEAGAAIAQALAAAIEEDDRPMWAEALPLSPPPPAAAPDLESDHDE